MCHKTFTYFSSLALLCTLFLGLALPLNAQEEILESLINQGVTVDLRSPTFSDGELYTDQGGVVSSGDLRIQARCIRYTRIKSANEGAFCVEAEGDLMINYGNLVFVGERAYYNFETRSGSIHCGRTVLENWHFFGDTIYLRSDGSYDISGGSATTCENCDPHWRITSDCITIDCEHNVCASNISILLKNLPVFWFPRFRANIDSLMDSPLDYRFAVGGHRRLMLGIRYQMFSWENLKTYLLLDYRVKPGAGGGFETEFTSSSGLTSFFTHNYVAHDRSDFDSTEDCRYRIQGLFETQSYDGCTEMRVSWDSLSDKDAASDYQDKDFFLKTAERSELFARHQSCDFISTAYSRVRLNSWETVRQEAPHLKLRMRPQNIANSGLYADFHTRAAYLDYSFSNEFPESADFNSTRWEIHPRAWRPFHFSNMHITPEASYVGIYYGKTPTSSQGVWQGIGRLEVNSNCDFYRCYGNCKHQIRPYVNYEHSSLPTVHFDDHHIFGLMDGWHRMNRLTYGLQQWMLISDCYGLRRLWTLDLWAHSFFRTDTIARTTPRYYAQLLFNPTTQFSGRVDTAWDVERKELAYLNVRAELTAGPCFALAGEWRHRESYDWRKADRYDFMLDQARSETALRNSILSDKRDTLLLHAFYRVNPIWSLEWVSRYGWNRSTEEDYLFYEFSAYKQLHCGWNLRLSYQHREQDDRVTFALHLKPKPPSACDYILTDYLR